MPKLKLSAADKAQLARDVAAFYREGREFLNRSVGPRKAEQPATLYEPKENDNGIRSDTKATDIEQRR